MQISQKFRGRQIFSASQGFGKTIFSHIFKKNQIFFEIFENFRKFSQFEIRIKMR